MAASQEQKVDFLLKKIGYVQSKTGIAEDASGISGTKKAPTEENKPSPLVVPSTSVWADSTFIPASPPTSNTTYVGIYTATNAFQLTHDNTVTGNRTFIARSTFGNQTASISGDWIDPSFGADYAVQVYKGDPNSGGVSLSPTGSGNSDEWFFDYSSGILNFNGTNVPSGITTSNVYLIGYKYLGAKGVLPPAGRSNLTTLNVSGLSTFTGNVDANGDLDVDGHTELDNLNVSGVSTFQGNVNLGDDDILYFGDDQDLEIFHNSSNNNTIIQENNNGNLVIKGTNLFLQSSSGEDFFKGDADGAVTLYYDDSKKFETTGVGVSIVNGTSDTATIYGPSNLIIDPMPVGVGTTSGIVRIKGDLYVDGTQFTVASSTIELADFVVGIATTVPNDILLDGAGIGIGTNKTFLYEYNSGTNPSLKSSENLNVASGKVYQIAETERLSADTLSLGTGTTIHSPGSNILTLGTNGEERVRITSAGNVGIGTDNPTSLLHLSGTTASSVKIQLQDVDSGFAPSEINIRNGGRDLRFAAPQDIYFEDLDTGTKTLYIKDGGNVGIGTDAPTAKLDVRGTVNVSGVSTFTSTVEITPSSNVQALIIDQSNAVTDTNPHITLRSGGPQVIDFRDSGNGVGLKIAYRTSPNQFAVENSEDTTTHFRIDRDDGRVELNHGGSKKFETTSGGIDVTGHTETDTLNVSIATTTASLTLANAGVAVTAILDEDGLTSNRDDALATQQSIKAYVDAQVTAQDLDFAGDTGTGAVDLDTQSFSIFGTTNEIETVGSGQSITIGLPNDVTISNDLTVSGDLSVSGVSTFTGETNHTSGLNVGTKDNHGRLWIADGGINGGTRYGFTPQYRYNVALINEQGSTNQALFLGDTSGGNSGDLFGISIGVGSNDTTGTETWSPKLVLKGGGELLLGSTSLTGTALQRLQVTGGAYVSGNLGVGVTNPSEELHISSSEPTIRLQDTDTTNRYSNIYQSGGGLFLDARDGSSNGTIIFRGINPTATEYARITSAGNVGINSTAPTEKLDVAGNIAINQTTVVGSATASLSTVTETAIHTGLSTSTYRSVEYNIQATQGTNFHVTKILALHNGTTAYHNEYGTIFNNTSVATFNVDVFGGNIRLLATGASASQTDYVINFTATKL